MGLSGLVGEGANEGLEDILARQLLAQQQAEQQRRAKAQEALQQQRMAQEDQQHGDMMSHYGRQDDRAESSRRDANNRAGVADMERQRKMMDAQASEARLEQELAAIMPSLPPAAQKALKLEMMGAKSLKADDLRSPEELDADGTRKANQVGAESEARERAEARYRPPPAPPRGPADMTAGQKFQATQSLRKSFDSESNAAREVAMQLQQMQAGLEAGRRGDMAAGSQAVLVTFQKILDPESVVRESEYARSASGQALLARIQGAMEQLARGGAGVPVDQLERFVALANTFAENQVRAALESKTQIEAIASEYGIDPKLVTRDIQTPGATKPEAVPSHESGAPKRFNVLGVK